ncbi:hypothetical protein [Streptomyces sp. 769]|uniref:hypothetical protein n=1 Tax=Streptomyces sp. 769 TaxID=1262452 RepID=UPI00131EC3F2|nr:hypothetical protein [Streptomyces sp. 769]
MAQALARRVPRLPAEAESYETAELDEIKACALRQFGRYEEAEASGYRSLALLRPELVRNRALALADLAKAQLHQGEVEQAVATACSVPIRGRSGRVAGCLKAFTRQLDRLAPGATATRQGSPISRRPFREHRRTPLHHRRRRRHPHDAARDL